MKPNDEHLPRVLRLATFTKRMEGQRNDRSNKGRCDVGEGVGDDWIWRG